MKRHLMGHVLLAICWAGPLVGRAADESSVVIWDQAARVDVGMGYHDNVLRSSIAPEGSGYVRTTADASLIRLSSADRILVLFLLGEDTRYFEGPVNYEQFFSATAQFSTPIGKGKETGAELNYLYQHQIIDASETEVDRYRVLVLGHGLAAEPYWEQTLGEKWSAKVEGAALRQIYEDELDDYWEGAARLSLIRAYGHRSEVSLTCQFLGREYDTRDQFDQGGNPLPGTELIYLQQEAEGEWNHYFDVDRKWRLTTRLGYMQSEDNGSGYFDYTRALVREQLRWRSDVWELRATARGGWYRYAIQQVDGNRRERSYIILSFRAERSLGEDWLAYVAAEHEWDDSNDPLDEYRDWYAEVGLGYDF